ncbi:YidE/YbjL duplication [Rhodopirellula maiorica SM1]|uniref:YidE/YbjL duplication n=1 Tax=Rhodopirellula maiorica SM1 TaxID=1265738 RepID=M5RDP4_9BACT|nr:TrkA C-terminal domain-containing protein [Rhodopirellula maiorica]EMI17191.1 YidE/YbjL duplication [Rhodopirellula maiorica SM1]
MSPLVVLLCIIAAGLFIGRLSILGISFGTSAILFVALLVGHFGWTIPDGFGTLGLALFVYCVGISAGPTFFRGLASRGKVMACLGAMIVFTGASVTWCCAKLLDLPADLAGGLMAGAMTSTPALGAISESVEDPAAVAVGFGVAYPIGIISVVLFVQLAFKWASAESIAPASSSGDSAATQDTSIQRRMVEIVNPGIVGKRPSQVEVLSNSRCQISRVLVQSRWTPTPPDYAFAIGDRVMLLGEYSEIARVAETLGVLHAEEKAILDADHERKTVVVTSPEIYGHSLKTLRLRSRYGVTVARIRRYEIEFVPSSQTHILFGDRLTLVGESANLAKIEPIVGHRPRTLDETDLLSVVIGIAIGIFVGHAELDLEGLTISLGIAGGPLMAGLLLGHFRKVGPIRGAFPPAAMLLMTEAGLALFLADAGIKAGKNVGPVLAQHGLVLCLAALAIVCFPLLVGYCMARFGFGLSLLQNLGATCGGMTSTPGLAVLTGSTESSQPVTSYVAAYPVALVMITILGPMLVEILNWM